MQTATHPFFYQLLLWIRASRRELAARDEQAKPTCGLSHEFIQWLFAYERTFRGVASALRQPQLQLLTQEQRWPRRTAYRANPECITPEQRDALYHALEEFYLFMRQQRDNRFVESGLFDQLLKLPAPPAGAAASPMRRFYATQASRFTTAWQERHPSQSRRFSFEYIYDLSGYTCKLQTKAVFQAQSLERSSYAYGSNSRKEEAYRADCFHLPHPKAESFGGWMEGLTANWRALQAQLEQWFDHDERMWPTSKYIDEMRRNALREKLRKMLCPEELELLRSGALSL